MTKVLVSNIAKKYGEKYILSIYRYCIRKVSPILVPILKKYHQYYWLQYQYSNINNPVLVEKYYLNCRFFSLHVKAYC